RSKRDWSSDVCSSDLGYGKLARLNSTDCVVEVPTRVLDAPRVVRQNHQRILLSRLRGPVQEQTIDAPPVSALQHVRIGAQVPNRSEEHTSELQSRFDL